MGLVKELLQHLAERFIGGLVLAGLVGGLVGTVNACHPLDGNSSDSSPSEQLNTSGQ